MTTSAHSPLHARLLADLQARDAALRATLRRAASAAIASADRSSEVSDFKDAAALDSDAQVQEIATELALAELAQVGAALRRLEDGSYGSCASCGTDIDERRLVALPAAALCTECQEAAERHATA